VIEMTENFDDAALSEAALEDWNREEEDAAWAHLQQPGEGAVTPMLEQAIRAARELAADDQDALAAEMLEWIEDERRWADSFARTHKALAELAREALAEHHAGQTHDLDAAYAEMAANETRESEAAEWSESLIGDVSDDTDDADEPRRASDD
jgi:hypothetical protein